MTDLSSSTNQDLGDASAIDEGDNSGKKHVSVSVIIACYNRMELTVRSIELAQAAADFASVDIAFTVYDDGSTDGTAKALALMPQEITVLNGPGNAYWAKSMAAAEKFVLSRDLDLQTDLLIWLNDDVMLDIDAIRGLVQVASEASFKSVVVGAVRDPHSGEVSYSGMRRKGLHPLSYQVVPPLKRVQEIDTFNGNLVVVPVSLARALGGIDGKFSHGLADIDYGLRSRRAGVPVLLASGTYGTCSRNPTPIRGRLLDDWRGFLGPKGGGNFASLRRILMKSDPTTWPLAIAASYLLWWLRRARGGWAALRGPERGRVSVAKDQPVVGGTKR
jgi:GT2 family glycosyltransferase